MLQLIVKTTTQYLYRLHLNFYIYLHRLFKEKDDYPSKDDIVYTHKHKIRSAKLAKEDGGYGMYLKMEKVSNVTLRFNSDLTLSIFLNPARRKSWFVNLNINFKLWTLIWMTSILYNTIYTDLRCLMWMTCYYLLHSHFPTFPGYKALIVKKRS